LFVKSSFAKKIVSRFVASPCLLKIFRCKIFFGKNVKPSLRQASPCFILLNAKFSKNCQSLSEASPCLLKIFRCKIFFGKNVKPSLRQASPRGEAPCEAR